MAVGNRKVTQAASIEVKSGSTYMEQTIVTWYAHHMTEIFRILIIIPVVGISAIMLLTAFQGKFVNFLHGRKESPLLTSNLTM